MKKVTSIKAMIPFHYMDVWTAEILLADTGDMIDAYSMHPARVLTLLSNGFVAPCYDEAVTESPSGCAWFPHELDSNDATEDVESPAMKGLDFGQALAAMKQGKNVRRSCWDKGGAMGLETGFAHDDMVLFLATDWEIVNE